jgi:FKBP-type peptidyl-prolyl cis-trans isomerase FkpA
MMIAGLPAHLPHGVCVRILRVFRPSFVVCAVLWCFVAGCDDSSVAPSHFAPFSKTDIRAGTGTEANTGGQLSVDYTGWLYDESKPEQKGVQFDSSAGSTPLSFVLGSNQVIQGWDQGIVGMKVGGVRRLVIPPSLAYGGSRNGPIPPNATLVFEIELLSVQ